MERCSCFRRHTSHIRVGHFHCAAACQTSCASHAKRCRRQLPARVHGQGIRMSFRKNHIAAACERCVFLRVQRSHVKRSVRRFDRCAADFRLQRVDRRIFLRFDFRIACRSRERSRVYAARCRFCSKRSRSHVIQLRFVIARQRRFTSRSEFLDMERCSCFRRHTSHSRFAHFHRTAACERCVFLRVQRRHVKFAFGRFDRRTAGFRLQRANRHVFLRFDFRIACRSRERSRFHAARCRFCGKRSRSHVIQLRFVLAHQRRFAKRSELLDLERASCICRHTSHGRFGHFHRTAACQTSCACHAKRCRTKRSPRFRGQALRIQRSHIKFAFRRFDRRVAGFCLQRADRHIFLCSDRRIACRSRERTCVYAARCRFCGKRSRGHVIQRRFVLARQRRFASRSELLDMERASCICRHTSHGRVGHFHRATACQTSCASYAKRCRRQFPARFRGQGIRMGFRKNHIAAAGEFCVFLHIQRFRTKRCTRFRGQALCIQRSPVKFAVCRFDRCAAGFCLQRADRRICLCSDFRIACRSRERTRVYTASRRNSKRACFCFVERDIVICLDGRAILRAEFLDLEHAMCGDLCLSFF